MYERFTDRARDVMQLAIQEARRLNHEYIGTEHILLGLIAQGPGVAAHLLQGMGIELSTIRNAIERIVCSGPTRVTEKDLPQTPRAKKVIAYSVEAAQNLNHNYIGTEHILLGLLREQEGVAAQVLMNLGLTLATAREAVSKLLGEDPDFLQLSRSTIPARQPEGLVRRFVRRVRDSLVELGQNGHLFGRYTDRARKVMQLANQEAHRLNHEYIGTEHVLLGLVAEGSGVAAHVLMRLSIDQSRIRVESEKLVPAHPDLPAMGKLPLTPRARKAIEYAQEEAFSLNHNYVGTEHLLLGLLREQEGVAAQVLMNLGLKPEDVRSEVLNLLGHGE